LGYSSFHAEMGWIVAAAKNCLRWKGTLFLIRGFIVLCTYTNYGQYIDNPING